MKNIYLVLVLACGFSYNAFSQDTAKIKMAHEALSTVQRNLHIVFSRTPPTSNYPGNASQTYKGDDFIYGRVYFSKPLKDVLFLEKNTEGTVPVDVYVEDLLNHQSLYISFNLNEDELDKTFFDFDILPDPDHVLRTSKEFETGRFSYFLNAEGLENKRPVFKFTIGDAVGYIQVDFSSTNLQAVKQRDFAAYQKGLKATGGDEQR